MRICVSILGTSPYLLFKSRFTVAYSQQNMASSNNTAFELITPLVIKFLVFLALIDNVALADVSERYHVVKNQQNAKMCANTTSTPGKSLEMVRSPIACSGKCSSVDQCVGFNYRPKERVCELFDHPGPTEFGVMEGCSYHDRVCRILILTILHAGFTHFNLFLPRLWGNHLIVSVFM